ncbi:DUF6098 family protein [Actinacidiphila glaucinigra]|uniref:DUF6098 family protein n=1 Tax=Actinacidiphila glaucinigra TaxID=235986 RepID=UPI0037171FA5
MPLGRLRRSVEVRPRPKRNETAPRGGTPTAAAPPASSRLWTSGAARSAWSCGAKLRPGGLVGRCPDSEPLVAEVHPLASLSAVVIAEAETDVPRRHDGWGTLRRATPPAEHGGS